MYSWRPGHGGYLIEILTMENAVDYFLPFCLSCTFGVIQCHKSLAIQHLTMKIFNLQKAHGWRARCITMEPKRHTRTRTQKATHKQTHTHWWVKSGDRLLPRSSPWPGQQSASEPGVQWGCCPWSAGPGSGPPAHPWTPAVENQAFAFHLEVYETWAKPLKCSHEQRTLIPTVYKSSRWVQGGDATWRNDHHAFHRLRILRQLFFSPTVCCGYMRAFCLIRLQLPWRRDELHLLCQLYNHR